MSLVVIFLPKLVLAILILCYILYAVVFLKYRNPTTAPQRKSKKSDFVGIILQTLSYGAAWSFRRTQLVLLKEKNFCLEITMALLTTVLALSAIALVASSKRTLGKQWGPAARIVDGHELVTGGLYRHVRHPLYLGMFGLLLATILGLSSPLGSTLALIIFGLGTTLRIRTEEKLLLETFGKEFEDYTRRVPIFFPRL